MSEFRLEMRGVVKQFPGVKALDHAQLKLRPGTVHALMGENGAGKSTLMKCLFGMYVKDGGQIFLHHQIQRIRFFPKTRKFFARKNFGAFCKRFGNFIKKIFRKFFQD